jgi:hypothetical protein
MLRHDLETAAERAGVSCEVFAAATAILHAEDPVAASADVEDVALDELARVAWVHGMRLDVAMTRRT